MLIPCNQILAQQIQEILADPAVLTSAPHPIIYHSLLNFKDAFTESTLGFNDLNEEASLLVFAGTDTSSNTITTGTIHSIENRRVYRTLKAELLTVWPNLDVKPSYETLEKLPYLDNFVRETLRVYPAVAMVARQAAQDTVIPVADSYKDRYGVVRTEIRCVFLGWRPAPLTGSAGCKSGML